MEDPDNGERLLKIPPGVVAAIKAEARQECVNEIWAQIEGWRENDTPPASVGDFVGHAWKAYLGGLEDAARGLIES
jgi:hypothetical protein